MGVNLSEALEHHERGDLEQAARIYEAALAEQPDEPDALHLLGLVALQRGEAGRAVELIGRAVSLRPNAAAFHADLAEAYWSLGRIDEVIDCCEAALRLEPESPGILCNLGATLVARGDLDAALVRFHQAVRLAPDFAVARSSLGHALRLKGDRIAAMEQFRHAARLEPASSEPHSALGEILLSLGEPEQALPHCQEAIRIGPATPTLCVTMGNVLHSLGRLGESLAWFREVIRQEPTLAGAHAGLAGVLEELGDIEESQDSLREALRHDRRHAGAWARLATRLRDRLPEFDRAAIEDLLSDPNLASDQRWPLLFGMAHVLDGGGEFEPAAGLFAEANALQLADFRAQGRGYDPVAHRTFVDRLIAKFTPGFFERVRGAGLDTERPVFIVGMPRSGTTLVEQILASHPRVFGAGELRLVRESFEALPAETDQPLRAPLDCVDHLDRDSLRNLSIRHLDALTSRDRTADRVIDKMPENTLYLGLIAAMFPRARLIYCRRDPRDVALSCWMTHFAEMRWACDIDHIASRIVENHRVMDHWRRVLPVPIFEVEYEAIVADVEGVSRQLVEWCGLDWDPACLDFHETRRPVRTTSVAQVRSPIYSSSVGRWKNYERPLAPLFAKVERSS